MFPEHRRRHENGGEHVVEIVGDAKTALKQLLPLIEKKKFSFSTFPVVDGANLPPLDAMDPEGAYLTWTVEFSVTTRVSSTPESSTSTSKDCWTLDVPWATPQMNTLIEFQMRHEGWLVNGGTAAELSLR